MGIISLIVCSSLMDRVPSYQKASFFTKYQGARRVLEFFTVSGDEEGGGCMLRACVSGDAEGGGCMVVHVWGEEGSRILRCELR